jgi:arsenical pump membrane protein
VLSLDATVVLLTPVVVLAAAGTVAGARPMVYACVRLANSSSLLLPVSNLTNLLAMRALGLSVVPFVVTMAPVWLVVLAGEYVGHRLFFRRDLAPVEAPAEEPEALAMPRFPVLVVLAMLVGFAVTSPLGIAPAWVATAAAVVLTGRGLRRGSVTVRAAWHALHPTFAVYVLCLGVVVVAVADTFLGRLVAAALPHGSSLGALLAVMVTATVLANVVNNLPATLLVVPLAAPLGPAAVLAALIGLNVGSNLTDTGSLANLLWRRTLVQGGMRPSTATFHRLSALVTLPTSFAAVVVLWLWAPLVHSRGSVAAQRGQQLLLGRLEEIILPLVPDLHHGDVGETGLLELADRLHDRVDVRPARDGVGDVLGADELGRAREPGRSGQLGVDLPAAAEPPELVVRPLHRAVAVGVPADRKLADLP